MRARPTGATTLMIRTALLGSALMLACIQCVSQAQAATQPVKTQTTKAPAAQAHVAQPPRAPLIRAAAAQTARPQAHGLVNKAVAKNRVAAAPRSDGISCVPYARMVSGITVAGNAWQWWDNASGTYARGKRPEVGSVLAFRSNYAMRLGHVAVVSQVINGREILINHANWPRGGVWRDVAVVDVSAANDWSAVRVERGQSADFGSVYPVNGFIYNRPDNGIMEASTRVPAPQVALNPAPRDLRPAAERGWQGYDEVAEAPARPRAKPARQRAHH